MKSTFASFVVFARQIDPQSIQLALVIFSLGALALDTGAPTDGGGGR